MDRQEIIKKIVVEFLGRDAEKARFILRHVNDMDLLSIAHGLGIELKDEVAQP